MQSHIDTHLKVTPLTVFDEALFESIVNDLVTQGFSVQHDALPRLITDSLLSCQRAMAESEYQKAGIGRASNFQHADAIRTDDISWITGSTAEGEIWLSWCDSLKTYINKTLFMGLFSFESHFACYDVGAYYKRHVDAFKGQSNRVLSLVAYLNEQWSESDGGELVLYKNEDDEQGITVRPEKGTFVIFLSEQFPHEVLTSNRQRHSVAGWFRINGSINAKIDPPR
ncbi:2OG-Fe(II) oxygenase [Alteromonas sp. A081]|uniref:2OG-Fe(II) oxygenase n=1 Tax=Alteromonas sp. A081 TaxID=3410269 RepID=UPI003B9846D8